MMMTIACFTMFMMFMIILLVSSVVVVVIGFNIITIPHSRSNPHILRSGNKKCLIVGCYVPPGDRDHGYTMNNLHRATIDSH